MNVRAQPVLYGFLWPWRVERKITHFGMLYFTLYLHNRQNGNLRAIVNCVCSIRSVERNMTSFLRTVYLPIEEEDWSLCWVSSCLSHWP
jgi:hypothetical protein